MSGAVSLVPIGRVVGGRETLEDDAWGGVEATIVLADHVPDGALEGLGEFSHLEVIVVLDQAVDPSPAESSRRPRGRSDLPQVGVLAQRHKDRIGRIGLSRCEILVVNHRSVRVRGLDAVDGTPVIDLKPWFSSFGPRGAVREPSWVAEVVAEYY